MNGSREIMQSKGIKEGEWVRMDCPNLHTTKKDGIIQFIHDFGELNKHIKWKLFSIPKMQGLLLKLEGYQFATSLDHGLLSHKIKH